MKMIKKTSKKRKENDMLPVSNNPIEWNHFLIWTNIDSIFDFRSQQKKKKKTKIK